MSHEYNVQEHVHYHKQSWKQKICYLTIGALLGAYLISGGCATMMDKMKESGTALENKISEAWESIHEK